MNQSNRNAQRQEALARATQSQSLSNLPAVYAGFIDKGISESDILPRVNVFTYAAWQALGRQVRRGEHGVRISTFVEGTKAATEEEPARGFKFARTVSVFHISQTDAIGESARAAA